MKDNRSMPSETVTPVLVYRDMKQAIDWLTRTFGFKVVWVLEGHNALLSLGAGMVNIRPPRVDNEFRAMAAGAACSGSILWRLDDVTAHFDRVSKAGARILMEPRDEVFGERQYAVADLDDHHWTFTETIADVAPSEWGAQGTAG